MAIYRPPKARWPLAVMTAVAGLLVGLVAGLILGRSEPAPSDSVPAIRTGLIAAAGSLDVAIIEYTEAVPADVVTRDAEYEGALDAVASGRARYEEVRGGLVALAPERAEAIDALFDEVEALMERPAPAPEVEPVLAQLLALLKGE